MAELKRKATAAKQVVDVRKPGKSAADSTSKPIIVTNRQIIRDPMVTTEATSPVPEAKTAPELPKDVAVPEVAAVAPEEPAVPEEVPVENPTAVKREIVIAPLDADEPELTTEAEEPANEPAETTDTTEAEAEPEPASTEKLKTEIPDAETNVQAAEDAAAEAEAKRQEELSKLAENKQYFLPINAVEQRRAQQFIVIGIVASIVLALAWLNIALDAGLIQIDSIKPVTNFFSN